MIWRRSPWNGGGIHFPSGAPVQVGCTLSVSMPVRMMALKVAKVLPPSGLPVLSGVRLRERSRPRKRTEVSAATQVGVHIDHLFLTKVRVPVGGVFVCWARRMAAIAAALCVHNIASQSHQLSVLPQEVQRNRRDLKSSINLCFFPFVIVVVVGSYVSRTIHHSRGNDRNKCCDYSRGFNKVAVCHGNIPFYLLSRVVISVLLSWQNVWLGSWRAKLRMGRGSTRSNATAHTSQTPVGNMKS